MVLEINVSIEAIHKISRVRFCKQNRPNKFSVFVKDRYILEVASG